jgi:hypothetical protein
MKLTIGFDAKRIVSNATGLGSYGRTLVNDLIRRADDDVDLLLYAPNPGRDDLRQQILINEHVDFRYPQLSIVNCQLSILNSSPPLLYARTIANPI